jgi:hypothetical protein
LQATIGSDLLVVVMISPSGNQDRCSSVQRTLAHAVALLERALLQPNAESELVARAAARVAWQRLDDLAEPDERTGAVLDAFARLLALLDARQPVDETAWELP